MNLRSCATAWIFLCVVCPTWAQDALVVEGAQTLVDAELGAVRVEPGATLLLAGVEAAILDDVVVRGGTLRLEAKHVRLPSSFTHERTLTVRDGGTLEIRGARLSLDHPVNLHVEAGAHLRVEDVLSPGAPLSVGLRPGSEAQVERAIGLGELIADAGSRLRIAGSRGFAVWLVLRGPFGDITLPPGASVDAWSWNRSSDIEIRDSRDVFWAALTAPGARGAFVDSQLRAVAMVFGGRFRVRIDGLRNQELPEGGELRLVDRHLRFPGSTVQAWNVYVVQQAELEVHDSRLGEVWAFDGSGTLRFIDSHADGTGGNVRAQGQARMEIVRSVISSDLVADDAARIEIRDSRIERSVNAVGSAQIDLHGVQVEGEVRARAPARVVRHP